jgi:uncharacterized integral membrane protein (TIGR00698 family)
MGLSIHFIAPYFDWMNGVILGLFAGIIWGNLYPPKPILMPGVQYAGAKLLELSILFLAFSIQLKDISKLGWSNFLVIGILVLGVLLLTLCLSNKFKCPNATGWLVGFGTAICGSSAVAAVAPAISKDKEDAGIALAVVNLVGTIGMIILPLLLGAFAIDPKTAGIIIGGTLHSVGNVAGAGYGMSDQIGDTAITIKLARVALLSPAVIFFTYLTNKNQKEGVKTSFALPWYLWAFTLITLISSFVALPKEVLKVLSETGKIVLTIAMFAIGLRVSFKTLYYSGKKALGFGLILFVIQLLLIAVLLILVRFIQ